MRGRILLGMVFCLLTLQSCGATPEIEKISFADPELPASRWDIRPESDDWTAASLAALDRHGAPLVKMVPRDIQAYCPDYIHADAAERKEFWVNFLASLANHESTFRPEVAGGGGKWIGLLQIAPATARGYGCRAGTADGLKNGAANLSCGIRIMAETIPRDGVISAGMRGAAADWGPFHSQKKREDIQSYTRNLEVCRL